MVLFTFVFGHIARFQNSISVPYPIFAYSALVPWSLFQSATNYSVNAVISNAPIIRKIYCPREVFPIGAVISSGADFLISMVILFAMCFSYGFFPTWVWLALIPLLVALVVMLLALSMIFSVAVAYFRDVRYVVPSVLSVLLFLTPIAYPLNRLTSISLFRNHPGLIKAYSYINPLAPIIDGFRRVLVFNQWPEWSPFGFATALSVVGLIVAYRWYKQVDGYLADVI